MPSCVHRSKIVQQRGFQRYVLGEEKQQGRGGKLFSTLLCTYAEDPSRRETGYLVKLAKRAKPHLVSTASTALMLSLTHACAVADAAEQHIFGVGNMGKKCRHRHVRD